MHWGSLFALAFGLAADATAVAAARGLAAVRVRARDALLLAVVFGGLQGVMPLCGWFAGAALGRAFGDSVARWDHWVAFVLLTAIGAKMLHEAQSDDADDGAGDDVFRVRTIVLLGIATSIDALVAGLTLPLLGPSPWLCAAVIAGVTAAMSVAAVLLGKRLGSTIGKRAEVAGGVVLIAVAARLLWEHLAAP